MIFSSVWMYLCKKKREKRKEENEINFYNLGYSKFCEM